MVVSLHESETGRLRASLRGLLPVAITAVLVILASVTVPPAVGLIVDTTTVTGTVVGFLAQWILIYVLPIGIALWVAIRLDRGTLARFGLDIDRRWLVDWGAGIVVSLFAVVVWLAYGAHRGLFAVHPERLTDFGDASLALGLAVLGLALVFTFLGNVYEELVFRGIMLQNFAEGLTARGIAPIWAIGAATAGSVMLFALYHIPFGGPVFALITIPTGFVFALAYLLTGRLGFAIGVHMGRFPIELFPGLDAGAVTLPTVVDIGQLPLARSLESIAVVDGLSCLLILAWVYVSRGEISISRRVYEPGRER